MAVVGRRTGEKSRAQSKKRADEPVLGIGVIRGGDADVDALERAAETLRACGVKTVVNSLK